MPTNNTDAPPAYSAKAQMGAPPIHMNAAPPPPSNGGDKKNAPPAPNYTGAAEQQAHSSSANVDAQTQANRPDQTNAFGSSVHWTKNPDGSYTQTQQLGSGLQEIEDRLMQQAKDAYGKPLDDGSAVRQSTIDASYNQATSRLNPQWAQNEEQLESKLANQGLDPNSAAFQNALRTFGQAKNDAFGSAMNSAVGEGNQAQALTFAQNMATRNAPGQELAALQGFLGMPGFQAAGMADPTQYLAAAMGQGNFDLQAWMAKNKATADAVSGGMDAAGSLAKLLPLFA